MMEMQFQVFVEQASLSGLKGSGKISMTTTSVSSLSRLYERRQSAVLCSKLFGTIARVVCRRHFRSSNEKAKTTKMAILYNLRVYTKAQILNMILVTQFHTSDKARPMHPSHKSKTFGRWMNCGATIILTS